MTARDELIEAGARALRHAFYPHDELHVPIDETLWWTYARLVLEAFEATYKESLQVEWGIETTYSCGDVGVRVWGSNRESIALRLPDYPGGRLVHRRAPGPWERVEGEA